MTKIADEDTDTFIIKLIVYEAIAGILAFIILRAIGVLGPLTP